MNINDLTSIVSFITSMIIGLSIIAGFVWFIRRHEHHAKLSVELERKEYERSVLEAIDWFPSKPPSQKSSMPSTLQGLKTLQAAANFESMGKRPAIYCDAQKEPITAKVRIEDVGVIAYINE